MGRSQFTIEDEEEVSGDEGAHAFQDAVGHLPAIPNGTGHGFVEEVGKDAINDPLSRPLDQQEDMEEKGN